MKLKQLLVSAALLLSLSTPAFATTWYVATTGSDSNNGTAVGTPFRSIQKACNSVQAGDTATVADGTYTATDNAGLVGQAADIVCWARSDGTVAIANGTAQAPITIKSTNPRGAKITLPSTASGGMAFRLSRTFWIIEGFEITSGASPNNGTSTAYHAVFLSTASGNDTIRKNWIHDIGRTVCSNSGFGYTGIFHDGGTGNTVTQNLIHGIGRLRNGESSCSTTIYQNDHGLYLHGGSSLTISRNIIYDTNRGYPIQFFGGTMTSTTVVHNTIGGHATTSAFCGGGLPCPRGQIIFGSTVTTATVKNNIFYDPGDGPLSRTSTITISGVTYDGNLTDDTNANMFNSFNGGKPSSGVTDGGHNLTSQTAASIFVNAGSNNYNLVAASPAIDAGQIVSGYTYNVNPDIGAFETFTGAPTCVVENATSSKLSITFTNNVNPPLLPASPAFGANKFTARKAAVDDPLTAAVRTGTNQIDLTLTNAIVGGNAVDFSYSITSGDVTDSALIGGTLNQRLNAITNQSCTNNVGAGATYVLTQAAFAWHGLRGTEASPVNTPYATAPESTNIFIVPSGKARLRISIKDTVADAPGLGYIPYYSRNVGAYTVIPDTYSADGIAFCGTSPDTDIPASGTATTNQLSTTGTFVPGALIRTSNAIPTITIPTNQKTENEYCLAFDSTSVAGDTFDIRVRRQDGTVLDAYTVTPRVTIHAQSQGSGF